VSHEEAPTPCGAALDLDDYDFDLPQTCIAQTPPEERDGGRLLVLDRDTGQVDHDKVLSLPTRLRPGDLLVRNATRVLTARLRGRKASGGQVEALILGNAGGDRYHALVRCGSGRLRPGLDLHFERDGCVREAQISAVSENGIATLVFAEGASPYDAGEAPLPPYIRRDAPDEADQERYQTTFARVPGSIAAPTAGLHLSERVQAELAAREIECAEVVLHVGVGTFRPLRDTDLAAGTLHPERFELPEETARAVAAARDRGGRVVAVGTTTARVLESCACGGRRVEARSGETDLFLQPGANFRVVDSLLTNFHLPRSSLLLLVAAFAGREPVLAAYREAIRLGYRFYSYGDAMLIL
jgi:S-adenosylmethionine:tRNA ribosyltransferase-isomerase